VPLGVARVLRQCIVQLSPWVLLCLAVSQRNASPEVGRNANPLKYDTGMGNKYLPKSAKQERNGAVALSTGAAGCSGCCIGATAMCG
jgi:hypothetical protein